MSARAHKIWKNLNFPSKFSCRNNRMEHTTPSFFLELEETRK